MTVKKILSQKGNQVHTVKPDTKIIDAVRDLDDEEIGAVVVSKDGVAIDGILSERDIINALAEVGNNCLEWPVHKVMTKDVMTCTPNDRAIGIMSLMTEHRIRHVPVIDDEKMVGLISIGDVVKSRLDEVEADVKALQNYISNP